MGAQQTRLVVAGTELLFDTRDDVSSAWVAKAAAMEHEPGLTRLLSRDLLSSKVFADVGAFIGFFTILAGRSMPSGSVFSFEMDAGNFERLHTNVELNGLSNVEAHRVALSDRHGKSPYIKGRDRFGASARLGRSRRRFWNSWLNRVPTTTLDRFFAGRTPPDLVKIDVQGAELAVLRGMQGLLSDAGPVVYVEVHPGAMRSDFQADPADVPKLLNANGFHISVIPDFRAGEEPELRPFDGRLTGETMLYARKR